MIHFWADTHFGCDRLVANSRKQFQSVEEHDATLIDLCNHYVSRSDTLIFLGDFCKEKPGRYRPHIRCRHIQFILGNHDKEAKIKQVFGGNVWQARTVKLTCGERVYCHHFPCAFWDISHYGSYHAYGHIHNNLRYEAMMDAGLTGRRSMDVGVDRSFALYGEYRPISETMFMEHLKAQGGHDIIPENERWASRDY